MILVDSCVWIAEKNQSDQSHKKVCLLLPRIKNGEYGKPMVSDYIIDEVLTYLNRKAGHKIALEALQFFELEEIRIEKVNGEIIKDASRIFRDFDALSFTDATTVAIMKKKTISYIATLDRRSFAPLQSRFNMSIIDH